MSRLFNTPQEVADALAGEFDPKGEEQKLPDSIQHLADAIEKKGMRVTFGLQPEHIQKIETKLARYKTGLYEGTRTHMFYDNTVWRNLANDCGWDQFTLFTYYLQYLEKKTTDEQMAVPSLEEIKNQTAKGYSEFTQTWHSLIEHFAVEGMDYHTFMKMEDMAIERYAAAACAHERQRAERAEAELKTTQEQRGTAWFKISKLEAEIEQLKKQFNVSDEPAEIQEAKKYIRECEADLGFMGSPEYYRRKSILDKWLVEKGGER